MTGTETTNQHTILATRLGDLTVVRNAETVVGLYFPHHWYRPGPGTFGPRTDGGFDEAYHYLAGLPYTDVAAILGERLGGPVQHALSQPLQIRLQVGARWSRGPRAGSFRDQPVCTIFAETIRPPRTYSSCRR